VSEGFHKGLAESGQQQACDGHGPAVFWPRDAVHPDPELAGGGIGTCKLDFEIFVPAIILDRNSQVWYHKSMVQATDRKVTGARCRAGLRLNTLLGGYHNQITKT
jgi:hypothetical protein